MRRVHGADELAPVLAGELADARDLLVLFAIRADLVPVSIHKRQYFSANVRARIMHVFCFFRISH